MTTTAPTTSKPEVARVLGRIPEGLYIGGAWVPPVGGATFAVENPATGDTLARVADASPADGAAAARAAAAAQEDWAATPPRERGEILRRAYELIQESRDSLAVLITLEMGKPLAQAYAEIDYGAEFFRWFGEEAVRIDGGFGISPNGRSRLLVTRQPVGPCLLITPWNFPLAMASRKIGPALAAGCTVILKPAPETPLTSLAVADILAEAGVPAGVVNVVTTTDAAAVCTPLIEGGVIRKLSFTGSTAVGRRLIAQCAKHVLRVSMELGGNAPFLVFADADPEAAVEGLLIAKMRNMGEACTAANRVYAEAPIAEAFTARLAERMAALRLGPGLEPNTDVGPLIDGAAVAKASRLVADAIDRGARVLTGGSPWGDRGHFYAPTVLADVPLEAEMLHQEIFGPVAPVVSFEREEQALALANDTEYGLVGYVFTEDLDRALRVSEGLRVGMVGLNQGIVSEAAAPFGGVKHSGLGREGGRMGIEEYLDTKYVALAAPRRADK
ncbi:NAD-dependent succinate-semialdehyde dehydrogenase [Streptomyces puniciscabiei]